MLSTFFPHLPGLLSCLLAFHWTLGHFPRLSLGHIIKPLGRNLNEYPLAQHFFRCFAFSNTLMLYQKLVLFGCGIFTQFARLSFPEELANSQFFSVLVPESLFLKYWQAWETNSTVFQLWKYHYDNALWLPPKGLFYSHPGNIIQSVCKTCTKMAVSILKW